MNQMLKMYLLWFNFEKKIVLFRQKKNNKKIHFFLSKNKIKNRSNQLKHSTLLL